MWRITKDKSEDGLEKGEKKRPRMNLIGWGKDVKKTAYNKRRDTQRINNLAPRGGQVIPERA